MPLPRSSVPARSASSSSAPTCRGSRSGCDYGASASFPEGGLAARGDARTKFETALARLADDGVVIVRLFMLCDCRSGVCFDEDGTPTGLDGSFFRDVDVALRIAGERGISLMPVLLDFHVCDAPRNVSGVQLGGHATFITDPSRRSAFLARIVQPIAERYGHHPAIAAWDLFNEPDWCVRDLRTLFSARAVSFDAVRDCLSDLVECARSCARRAAPDHRLGPRRRALISCATWTLISIKSTGTSVRMGRLAQPVEALELDRPVLLGESSRPPDRHDASCVLWSAARARRVHRLLRSGRCCQTKSKQTAAVRLIYSGAGATRCAADRDTSSDGGRGESHRWRTVPVDPVLVGLFVALARLTVCSHRLGPGARAHQPAPDRARRPGVRHQLLRRARHRELRHHDNLLPVPKARPRRTHSGDAQCRPLPADHHPGIHRHRRHRRRFPTLVLMIATAVAGAWFGAGVVPRLPRRAIQVGMGVALLLAAVFMLAR